MCSNDLARVASLMDTFRKIVSDNDAAVELAGTPCAGQLTSYAAPIAEVLPAIQAAITPESIK